jgi:hypothetical protein
MTDIVELGSTRQPRAAVPTCALEPCLRHLWPDCEIFGLEKQQRLAAVYDNVFNFGDKNGVIAGVLRSP